MKKFDIKYIKYIKYDNKDILPLILKLIKKNKSIKIRFNNDFLNLINQSSKKIYKKHMLIKLIKTKKFKKQKFIIKYNEKIKFKFKFKNNLTELTEYYSANEFYKISNIILVPGLVFHSIDHIKNVIKTENKIIIFGLHTNEVFNFIAYEIVPIINKPFVVITGMEDTTFPDDIVNKHILTIDMLNNKYFLHWFAINKTFKDDKYYTSIPYGLDYWTLTNKNYFGEESTTSLNQDNTLQSIIKNALPLNKRINKIYANFHLNLTDTRHGRWRKKLVDIIPKDIIYYENSFLRRNESWKKSSDYMFVISPYGNGLDCIRTFEALCLGCIVIMKKCYCLEIIYYDLPVYFVEEWNDINEDLLKNIQLLFENKKFNLDKLKMNYWINLINNTFQNYFIKNNI